MRESPDRDRPAGFQPASRADSEAPSGTVSPGSRLGTPRRGGWSWWALPALLLVVATGSLGIRFEANPLGDWLEWLELFTYDARVLFQGGVPFADDRLAVVQIDERTFKSLERDPRTRGDAKWPFSNAFHAEVAEKLLQAGARAVAFDLLSFLSASRSKYRDEDQAFASMAARLGKVCIGCRFTYFSQRSFHQGYKDAEGHAGETWSLPAAEFKGIPAGFLNLSLDPDGLVRKYIPFYPRQSYWLEWSFAMQGLRLASFSEVVLPSPASGSAYAPPPSYLAFANPAELASRTLQYAEVMLASESAWADRVRGRLVFVGPLFTEAHDFFTTPWTRWDPAEVPTPGVFIHAMIANEFLTGRHVTRIGRPAEQGIAAAFLAIGLLLAWLAPPGVGMVAFVLLLLGYAGSCFLVFRASLLWLPLASPLLAGSGAAIPSLALRLMVSERKQATIKKMFSAYVSREVLAYVTAHPDLLKLEGEKREATVFFSDLKGFTTISETMPPERLSQIMNDYLTPMTEIIMSEKGYVDKYIGDAIMAVFGVPMPDPDHAVNGCRAAVRQRDRLTLLAAELEKTAGVRISARMGLNTGPLSAGNMGSRDRYQYTVMGDTVNQASRFEGANKIFGSRIMIGEGTWQAARDRIVARLLSHLTVKGKTQAVVVYELLEMREGLPADRLETLTRFAAEFEAALQAFLDGKVEQARTLFQEFLARHPEDGPAAFYAEQCAELLQTGIPQGFHGQVKLDTK